MGATQASARHRPDFAPWQTAGFMLLVGCAWDTSQAPGYGTEALTNAPVTHTHPAVVSLGSCTATIIAHGAALTAAHCRTDGGHVPLYLHHEDGTLTRIADATTWVSHPEANAQIHDVALAFFDPAASLSAGIQPIPPHEQVLELGATLELIGYGGMHDLQPLDYQKRGGQGDVSSVEEHTFVVARDSTHESMACFGDSGGPGLVRQGGQSSVAGIISHASTPCGAWTRLQRVDIHLDWIRETLRQNLRTDVNSAPGNVFGELQQVTTDAVYGWACDPDRPDAQLLIGLWYNDRWQVAHTTLPSSESVNQRCNGGSAHRFSHSLVRPNELCGYPIVAAAWNARGTPGGRFRLLEGSGTTVPCEDHVLAHAPEGELVSARRAGGRLFITGWARDPDSPKPVWVQFYTPDEATIPFQPEGVAAREWIGETQVGENTRFRAELDAPKWTSTVCAQVINRRQGGPDTPLGCIRPAREDQPAPD